MKKALLAAALAVFVATPVMAADLARPVYKAAPMPAVVAPSWTGFYVGLNGGYGWTQSTGSLNCITPGGVLNGVGCNLPLTGTVKPAGGLFGGQAGYNWQTGNIVYGLEADIQWSGIKQTTSTVDPCCSPAFAGPAGAFSDSAKLDWFGTVRGRLGFTVTPSALLYATGGLIYGREVVSSALVFPAVAYTMSGSSVRAGGTVGGGLEYAFTSNFSGKIEGLYYDMGSMTTAFTSPVTTFTEQTSYRFRGAIVRGGLNWKFNSLMAGN